MKYTHVTEKIDYSDLSSGRVLYSLPGASAFPVRLCSEIFQTCFEIFLKEGVQKEKYTIFDPCCGSGYHFTSMGFLYADRINKIICSDIDDDILNFTKRNLSLLSEEGFNKRVSEIEKLYSEYGKESHKEALESAERLSDKLSDNKIDILCYKDNVFSDTAFSRLKDEDIDIIFADVPYENLESWQGNDTGKDEIRVLLENLLKVTNENTLIAIASTKKQKVEHEKYIRVKKFKAGKRKITILKKG